MATIKFNETSPEVKNLQEKLNLLGYGLKADSNFGKNTLTAINNFQKLNKLTIVDFVDDDLYKKIQEDINLNSKIDKPSVKKIMTLHPKIRFEVLHIFKECYKQNLKIRIVQGYRTFAEQDELYAQGRTKPGPVVTKSRGGMSNHCYGLSIDFCLLKSDGSISWSLTEDLNDDGNKDWMQVVNIFKEFNYSWGGDWKFKDNPHIEKTFGQGIRTLLNLHNTKKVDDNGYVII